MKTPKITALRALVNFCNQAGATTDRDLSLVFADLHTEFSKRLAKEMRAVPADSPDGSQALAQVPHLEGSHA